MTIRDLIGLMNLGGQYSGRWDGVTAAVLHIKLEPLAVPAPPKKVNVVVTFDKHMIDATYLIGSTAQPDVIKVDGKDVEHDKVHFGYGAKLFPPKVWAKFKFAWIDMDGGKEHGAEAQWTRSLL